MNTIKAFQKVRELQYRKLKNEASIAEADLQGKYKRAYEQLCADIKDAQREYRVGCARSLRLLSEWLAEAIYIDTIDEGYERLIDFASEKFNESGSDPLFKELYIRLTDILKEK